jgi:hypothetical protein
MKRKIVCLCGSTRFKEAFEEANKHETLKGNIVLSVGWYGHCEDTPVPEEQKESLDELHLDKIRMADEIIFLNVGGYLGDSSLNELDFACKQHKKIRFLEPDNLSDSTLMSSSFER